jgi:hypothetical protein
VPATLICLRDPAPTNRLSRDVWTNLPTPEEAARALAKCTPECTPQCLGAHLLVVADPSGRTHVRTVSKPPVPPLAVELEMFYGPRRYEAERYPAPPEFNEPLVRPIGTSSLPERAAHAALLRAKDDGPTPTLAQLYPPPGGNPLPVRPKFRPTSPVPDETGTAGVTAPAPVPSGPQGPNHGLPLPNSRPCSSVEKRFWQKVTKSEGCWLWTASKTAEGYGQFWAGAGGGLRYAHHFAYELLNDPVPKGFRLRSQPSCPRHCVRPDHWTARPIIDVRKRKRRKPCPLPTEPVKPEPRPTPPVIPATKPSPPHWKTRWLPQRATS